MDGSFRASEENAAARAEGALHRQVVSPSCTPPPRLRHTPTGAEWGWVLKLRLQTSDQGEDWGWPCKNSLGWLEPDCNHN